MKFGEFKTAVINNYNSVFPNSICGISLGALDGGSAYITYHLAGNQAEFPNQIAGNDLFHIQFSVRQPKDLEDEYGYSQKLTDDYELPDGLILEANQKWIATKPTNEYMAYGSVSLPFRKTVGNADKIVATLLKYAEVTKKTLTELYELDQLPTNQQKDIVELVKNKLGLNESKLVEDEEEELQDADSEYTIDREEEPYGELQDVLDDFKNIDSFHEFVVDDLIDSSEDYEDNLLINRLKNRCDSILSSGCVSGIVGSLVYYSDTVKVFDEYADDIYDLIEDYGPDEFLDTLKSHVNTTEVILNCDTAKNWIVWIAYEDLVYQLSNILEGL